MTNRMAGMLVVGTMALGAVASGCGPGECGESEYHLPEYGKDIKSPELCGSDYGTFGSDQGGGLLWVALVPEFGNVQGEIGEDTWDPLLEAAIDVGNPVLVFPVEVSFGAGLTGRARWTDLLTMQHDLAQLTAGHLRLTSGSQANKYGERVFEAEWNVTFGDPSKPGPWYRFTGNDEITTSRNF